MSMWKAAINQMDHLLSFPSNFNEVKHVSLIRNNCGKENIGVNNIVHKTPSSGSGDPLGRIVKIGLPGKLILSKRKGLREVLFS